MRGDQLSRQWRIIRAIETSPNALTGYNFDTLKGYLTSKYGGRRRGGGGGDNEFEIVMRLVAEFLP